MTILASQKSYRLGRSLFIVPKKSNELQRSRIRKSVHYVSAHFKYANFSTFVSHGKPDIWIMYTIGLYLSSAEVWAFQLSLRQKYEHLQVS